MNEVSRRDLIRADHRLLLSHSWRDGRDNSRVFQKEKFSTSNRNIYRVILGTNDSRFVSHSARQLDHFHDQFESIVTFQSFRLQFPGSGNFTYETTSGVLRLARVISGLWGTLNRNVECRVRKEIARRRGDRMQPDARRTKISAHKKGQGDLRSDTGFTGNY